MLKQKVVVENKAGAGGTLGVTQITQAAPDGYTLGFVWNSPLTASPHTLALSYTPDSYKPLVSIGYSSYVLCAQPIVQGLERQGDGGRDQGRRRQADLRQRRRRRHHATRRRARVPQARRQGARDPVRRRRRDREELPRRPRRFLRRLDPADRGARAGRQGQVPAADLGGRQSRAAAGAGLGLRSGSARRRPCCGGA